MLHLVAYDIANPRRLRKVAKICEDYGLRMEHSVFECDLEEADMAVFWLRLSAAIDENEDRVIDYCIGKLERQKIRRLGIVGVSPQAGDILVL